MGNARVIFQSTLPARGATCTAPVNSAICLFQSTLPARGATKEDMQRVITKAFQSTLPARGATPHFAMDSMEAIFQSTLPARGATCIKAQKGGAAWSFQSTLPARGATVGGCGRGKWLTYFNPRSPHGERQYARDLAAKICLISIHAPRTGSDRRADCRQLRHAHFNPRSPHGERRDFRCAARRGRQEFQSTLPARGATGKHPNSLANLKFQSTLPARGATLFRCAKSLQKIHFNPRSPHGERHSSRTTLDPRTDFNPRSPHGERRQRAVRELHVVLFQSTLPARGATPSLPTTRQSKAFQSTLPARGATAGGFLHYMHRQISIHAPRTGSDSSALTTS